MTNYIIYKINAPVKNGSVKTAFKINGKYRYHFILKTPYKKDVYDIINSVYKKHLSNKGDVTISIDVNPNSMY